MNSEYKEIAEITQLELSPTDGYTGALLAKRFEKLMKRQYSEIMQYSALRRALDRLPPGPIRKAIAAKIQEHTADHARRIERHAARLVEDAATGKGRPAGSRR